MGPYWIKLYTLYSNKFWIYDKLGTGHFINQTYAENGIYFTWKADQIKALSINHNFEYTTPNNNPVNMTSDFSSLFLLSINSIKITWNDSTLLHTPIFIKCEINEKLTDVTSTSSYWALSIAPGACAHPLLTV